LICKGIHAEKFSGNFLSVFHREKDITVLHGNQRIWIEDRLRQLAHHGVVSRIRRGCRQCRRSARCGWGIGCSGGRCRCGSASSCATTATARRRADRAQVRAKQRAVTLNSMTALTVGLAAIEECFAANSVAWRKRDFGWGLRPEQWTGHQRRREDHGTNWKCSHRDCRL
jgi:hypothetical protein